MKGYLEEKLDVVRKSWKHVEEVLKKSASAPLGRGWGGDPPAGPSGTRCHGGAEVVDRAQPENLTVYQAVNEVTSTARRLGVSARLQLETLAGETVMRYAE